MVMGSSQRNALNETALGAANALANWSAQLVEEMEKQGVGRHPKMTREGEGPPSIWDTYTTDDKEMVTFERWRIRRLLDEMAELKRELRRFEKPKMSASKPATE